MKKVITKRIRTHKASVLITIIALLGLLTFVTVRAGDYYILFETDNNSIITPPAKKVADSTASGGQYVQFGEENMLEEKCSDLQNLKFCDDFDGAAGAYPDASKWGIYTSGSSWGSHCWKRSPQNISTDGQGYLKMTLIDEGSVQCTDYYGKPSQVSSGGMETGDRFTTNQGKFEIRAKLSCANSVWGVIWTSGKPWPTKGEIDIYEMFGNQKSIKHTVHAGYSGSNKWHKGKYYTLNERFFDDFHVYGMEWRQGYIQFQVDGVNTWRINKSDTPSGMPWPFDTEEQRILITLQYGSEAKGHGTPNLAELPSSMLIDYVRVFE